DGARTADAPVQPLAHGLAVPAVGRDNGLDAAAAATEFAAREIPAPAAAVASRCWDSRTAA
ncbi:MAG: hypothetical protein Q8R98_10805, partial [Rubrivivax sp.]|nr:hypothetical protein [Rubrivivax sp.]